jgi:hypothetical protein
VVAGIIYCAEPVVAALASHGDSRRKRSVRRSCRRALVSGAIVANVILEQRRPPSQPIVPIAD